jgi:hypothetical protein
MPGQRREAYREQLADVTDIGTATSLGGSHSGLSESPLIPSGTGGTLM